MDMFIYAIRLCVEEEGPIVKIMQFNPRLALEALPVL
jgi:hypothetical protein